ncbi:MAG: single-stranded-DNA-specific exonuclease [Bradymonadia bacterium]|jgi:single-stranded-DNA-specific exonuclease
MYWKRHKGRGPAASHYAREFSINELTAQVLLNRGFNGLESMQSVLTPDMQGLPDPFSMRHMDTAVRRVRRAIKKRERIHIHGDYDVDGVTSTSVVLIALRTLGADVHYHVINRNDAAVGLSVQSLRRDHLPDNPTLIITTDCGTSNNTAIDEARTHGIDVVVIDHHHPGTFLPRCAALLNPQQPKCRFEEKYLAAVGVAFQFVRALDSFLQREDGAWPKINLEALTDLVALGTISDLVPLVGMNRVMVHYGLDLLRSARRPGICALMRAARMIDPYDANADLTDVVTARSIGFRIAPLLNAAGRMNDANKCVELLSTESFRTADAIARELVLANTQRQSCERDVLVEALAVADAQRAAGSPVIVLANANWHPGVLGIVASRLVEKHNVPSLVAFTDESGMSKGSVRSPDGIDMLEALRSCRDLLETFGGHRVAAGVAFKEQGIDELRARLGRHVAGQIPDGETLQRELSIDATVPLQDLHAPIVRELTRLAPFGAGHPEPLFEACGVTPVQARAVNGRNVRLRLRQGSKTWQAFAFGMGPRVEELRRPVDIVFHPRLVRHGGDTRVELVLRDFTPSR